MFLNVKVELNATKYFNKSGLFNSIDRTEKYYKFQISCVILYNNSQTEDRCPTESRVKHCYQVCLNSRCRRMKQTNCNRNLVNCVKQQMTSKMEVGREQMGII